MKTHRSPTSAERVVADVIILVRYETHPRTTDRARVAIKPIVQARTGAGESLYWRALAFANAWTDEPAPRGLVADLLDGRLARPFEHPRMDRIPVP